VTAHDRQGALLLVDSLQEGKPISIDAFNLIRKCISLGAAFRECNCRSCRGKREGKEPEHL
jgi:hypothetical protein